MYYRIAILLLFLGHAFKGYGQCLPQGTFVYSTGYTYRQFTFKDNSEFEYFFSSCTGGLEGSGKFKFNGNHLTLTFGNLTTKETNLSPDITIEGNLNDTTFIQLKFFDQKDTTPISNVATKFDSRTTRKAYGTLSNDSGMAKLYILNTDLPTDIEISYLGVDPQKITITEKGIYSIIFPLNFEFIKPLNKGDKLEFIVDGFDDEEIILKEKTTEREFRSYVKKD